MAVLGNKNYFSMEIKSICMDIPYYSLYLYIAGNNILEYMFQGEARTFTWHTLSYVVEWIRENWRYIMDETDKIPYLASNESALQTIKSFLQSATDMQLKTMLEQIQLWYSRHGWFVNRDGAYLANVCFQKIGTYIEVSWDNRSLFAMENIQFTSQTGSALIECDVFSSVICDFVSKWSEMSEPK